MEVYRIICIVKLAISIFLAVTSLLGIMFGSSYDEGQNLVELNEVSLGGTHQTYELIQTGPRISGIIAEIIFLLIEIYIFVCINSLFLNIKEENCRTFSSGMPNNDGTIYQQQQPMMKPSEEYAQPPPYNATFQTEQYGQSSHSAIPMQQ